MKWAARRGTATASIAQGAGNAVCGLFGCFAGCAMIGQSIINFTSGGRGRISGTVGAILLILFVVSRAISACCRWRRWPG